MKKKQQTESRTTRQRLMKALRGLAASLFSVLLLAVVIDALGGAGHGFPGRNG